MSSNNVNIENINLLALFEKVWKMFCAEFKNENISLIKPHLIIEEYPNTVKNNVISRVFKSPYINKDDEVGGNLYYWIHQSFTVLWDVDVEKNEVRLYTKTNNKLAERFATLLRMDKNEAIVSLLNFNLSYAIADLCWKLNLTTNCENENTFTMENKKSFVYKKITLTLVNDENSMKVLNRFKNMFDKNQSV